MSCFTFVFYYGQSCWSILWIKLNDIVNYWTFGNKMSPQNEDICMWKHTVTSRAATFSHLCTRCLQSNIIICVEIKIFTSCISLKESYYSSGCSSFRVAFLSWLAVWMTLFFIQSECKNCQFSSESCTSLRPCYDGPANMRPAWCCVQ